MGITLFIIGIIGAIICYSVCVVPQNEYERYLDDEAQIKCLEEYQIKHGKVSGKTL